jgi:hypothetical protein
VTLADIGISEQRKELAMQAIAQVWTTGICRLSVAQTPEVIKLRQQGESINQPFIVLTETKFSYRYIPVWARYSPHRTRVEAHANMLSP